MNKSIAIQLKKQRRCSLNIFTAFNLGLNLIAGHHINADYISSLLQLMLMYYTLLLQNYVWVISILASWLGLPVFKNSVWSVSIRNEVYLSSFKFVTGICKNNTSQWATDTSWNICSLSHSHITLLPNLVKM